MYQHPSAVASATGDPHVKTLDGRSYTLLSQGTFLLWRLSGMEAELQSAGGEVKKTPVDWHLYAHYSGHQSFTKGLLLVDMSGGSLQQVLEITAQKCEWRARKANQGWTAVKSSEPSDLISLDAEGNDVTTFNLVTTNGAKFHNRLHMNVHTKDGKTGIAVLRLSCRPNHNLNLHITMSRRRELSLLSRYQVFESTTTSHAQCSLPDLNHDQPRPVFAAGPQPRPSTPSVRCRTSTTTIHAQCSLPDLNSYATSYAR